MPLIDTSTHNILVQGPLLGGGEEGTFLRRGQAFYLADLGLDLPQSAVTLVWLQNL